MNRGPVYVAGKRGKELGSVYGRSPEVMVSLLEGLIGAAISPESDGGRVEESCAVLIVWLVGLNPDQWGLVEGVRGALDSCIQSSEFSSLTPRHASTLFSLLGPTCCDLSPHAILTRFSTLLPHTLPLLSTRESLMSMGSFLVATQGAAEEIGDDDAEEGGGGGGGGEEERVEYGEVEKGAVDVACAMLEVLERGGGSGTREEKRGGGSGGSGGSEVAAAAGSFAACASIALYLSAHRLGNERQMHVRPKVVPVQASAAIMLLAESNGEVGVWNVVQPKAMRNPPMGQVTFIGSSELVLAKAGESLASALVAALHDPSPHTAVIANALSFLFYDPRANPALFPAIEILLSALAAWDGTGSAAVLDAAAILVRALATIARTLFFQFATTNPLDPASTTTTDTSTSTPSPLLSLANRARVTLLEASRRTSKEQARGKALLLLQRRFAKALAPFSALCDVNGGIGDDGMLKNLTKEAGRVCPVPALWSQSAATESTLLTIALKGKERASGRVGGEGGGKGGGDGGDAGGGGDGGGGGESEKGAKEESHLPPHYTPSCISSALTHLSAAVAQLPRYSASLKKSISAAIRDAAASAAPIPPSLLPPLIPPLATLTTALSSILLSPDALHRTIHGPLSLLGPISSSATHLSPGDSAVHCITALGLCACVIAQTTPNHPSLAPAMQSLVSRICAGLVGDEKQDTEDTFAALLATTALQKIILANLSLEDAEEWTKALEKSNAALCTLAAGLRRTAAATFAEEDLMLCNAIDFHFK